MTLAPPAVADQTDWLNARRQLLNAEKRHTHARDELAARRRELPWLEVQDDYPLTGPDGPMRLEELFGDHPQLVVYHFMYGHDWEEGCPICSFWADSFDGIAPHLAHRSTAFAVVSNAGVEQLHEYRSRMGWSFPWLSAAGTSFNADMGVSHNPGEGQSDYNYGSSQPMGPESPGLSVFARGNDGRIYLTYQTFARGLEAFNAAYNILDLTPLGRDEQDLPYPMAWVHRHDQYPS